MDQASRSCPRCHSPLPPNTDKCPKCDSTPLGLLVSLMIFCLSFMAGFCAFLVSSLMLPELQHSIEELEGFKSVFMIPSLIAGSIIALVASLIAYLSHRRKFKEYLDSTKGFLLLWLLSCLISAGAGVLIGGPFREALTQRYVTEVDQLLWEHCLAYDRSNEISVFQLPATQTRYYELAVAKYLLEDKHPIFVETHKRLLELAKKTVDQGRRYKVDYRLEEEFHQIGPDFEQCVAIFDGLTLAEIADYTHNIPSMVYITHTDKKVGYYTPAGGPAIQQIANVYVIDIRRGILAAVYNVSGSMPLEKVSSATFYIGTTGSSYSQREIKNRYRDLPLYK